MSNEGLDAFNEMLSSELWWTGELPIKLSTELNWKDGLSQNDKKILLDACFQSSRWNRSIDKFISTPFVVFYIFFSDGIGNDFDTEFKTAEQKYIYIIKNKTGTKKQLEHMEFAKYIKNQCQLIYDSLKKGVSKDHLLNEVWGSDRTGYGINELGYVSQSVGGSKRRRKLKTRRKSRKTRNKSRKSKVKKSRKSKVKKSRKSRR